MQPTPARITRALSLMVEQCVHTAPDGGSVPPVPTMVSEALLDRAPGCGPGTRGFESRHSPQARLPEWSKGALCKSVGSACVGPNPTPGTYHPISPPARASAGLNCHVTMESTLSRPAVTTRPCTAPATAAGWTARSASASGYGVTAVAAAPSAGGRPWTCPGTSGALTSAGRSVRTARRGSWPGCVSCRSF